MIGGGEQIEIVHAPAVAEVQRRLYARPHYFRDRPLAIEPELWQQANAQLKAALELRGWPILADGTCDRPNFLCGGVPVVLAETI